MEAIIKVKPAELDELIGRLKAWFANGHNRDVEITISIKDLPGKADYWAKLQHSIEAVENGEGVVFTVEEFEHFYQSKLAAS